MISSIDCFLDRKYELGKYVCINHSAEVWKAITGDDLERDIIQFIQNRTVKASTRANWKKVPRPVSPCLVIFHSKALSHCGVYFRGRVLHLTERDGGQFLPLHVVMLGYSSASFYVKRSANH